MKNVFRLEVIIESVFEDTVLKLLNASGATGYTLLRNVLGNGAHGLRNPDGLTSVMENSLFIIACEKEVLDRLVDPLKALLEETSGVCLVSESKWLSEL